MDLLEKSRKGFHLVRVYLALLSSRQNRRELARLLGIREQYLIKAGYRNPTPADAQGEAVPWYAYPAIDFLKSVVDPEWKVFEYGCGYSTDTPHGSRSYASLRC